MRHGYKRPLLCPTCGRGAVLVKGRELYASSGTQEGRDFGTRDFWACPNYRSCDTYVGTHPDGRPLGTLAGPMLRVRRRRAHRVFDNWWKAHGMTRGAGYAVLREQIGVGHIGEMDLEQCARVVETFLNLVPAGVMSE